MVVDVFPIREKHIEGYYKCLDSVAREKIYLAGVKARPFESTREFVLNNIKKRNPHFIAVKNGDIVGWCDIIPMKGFDFSHCGKLGMGVHSDFRGQGIGSRLLDTTVKAARDMGLERVELEVYTSNTVAIHMYQKYGFKSEGVKRKARKLEGTYFDIMVMALFLDQASD